VPPLPLLLLLLPLLPVPLPLVPLLPVVPPVPVVVPLPDPLPPGDVVEPELESVPGDAEGVEDDPLPLTPPRLSLARVQAVDVTAMRSVSANNPESSRCMGTSGPWTTAKATDVKHADARRTMVVSSRPRAAVETCAAWLLLAWSPMTDTFVGPVCPICETVVEWGANACVQHGDVMHARCCAWGGDRARVATGSAASERTPRGPQSAMSPRRAHAA
jgi:hypothetical protein